MVNVFVLKPNENWIIDRFVDEWNEANADITVTNPYDADVIWLLADFCWRNLPPHVYRGKKVLTSVHHVVPQKFDVGDFTMRDELTTEYHVPNGYTRDFIKQHTQKPIHVVNYWANQHLWPCRKRHESVSSLREKHNLPKDAFLIGSFQRDTEGSDLISPKLEKGPDLFADAVIKFSKTNNVHVVLGGWRRQYLIKRFSEANVPYSYFELPSFHVIRDLYLTLDLYLVTARHEGGPQSIIECAMMNVPIVSTPVGIAEMVLDPESINENVLDAVPNVSVAYENVRKLFIPDGFAPYRKLLQEI
jgi:hypothetical protein